MKLHHLALLAILGTTVVQVPQTQPAQACTPAPDHPDGCDGINGGRPKIPRPVCLRCPDQLLRRDQKVILPVDQLSRPIVRQQENRLDKTQLINPQLRHRPLTHQR